MKEPVASCTWDLCWFMSTFYGYHIRICFCTFIRSASFTFPSLSSPFILYISPCYGFQWSNIYSKPSQDLCFWRILICILNIPNAGHFVNFWYTYVNDFYFHCHVRDLWSSLLCRFYWKLKTSHIVFLCMILQLLFDFNTYSVKFVMLLLLLLSWLLGNKMQISYGNR